MTLTEPHLILLGLLILLSAVSHHLATPWVLLSSTVVLIYSVITGVLLWQAMPFLLLLAVSCWAISRAQNPFIKWVAGGVVFALSIALFLHLVPGFNNPKIIDDFQVSVDAIAYGKHLNLDKALVGVLLLLWVVPRASRLTRTGIRLSLFSLGLAVVISLLIANISGLVRFEPKWSQIFWFWCATNLFITCYAEEAFFRGFVQQKIAAGLTNMRYGEGISILLSGLLFGLAHFPAGVVYTIIASILGVAFAYGYAKTNNIYVPILGHFGFNFIHFTLFTYPYLMQV